MTREEFTRHFPNASEDAIRRATEPDYVIGHAAIYHDKHSSGSLQPAPKLERATCNESLEADSAKARNPTRYIIRITSYRRRLLDEDNLAEKYHIDALRYAGVIPSDAPDKAHIETRQVKVSRKIEEKTVVEISTDA